MTDSRPRRYELLALAAILAVYSGAFSPITLPMQFSTTVGFAIRGGLALMALPILVLGFVLNGRIRFPLTAAFGLLPYVYLLGIGLTGGRTEGAFIYLYKFAPYLCAGLLAWLLARTTDRALFWVVLSIGSVISLRAIAVFLFPQLGQPADLVAGVGDGFLVFDLVGALPRVFYPGMGFIFLGLVLALRGVIREGGWTGAASAGFLLLGIGGLLVSMTRGLLLIAAVLLVVQAVWILLDVRVSTRRKLNFTVAAAGVVAAAVAVVIVSGLGSRMLKGVGDIGSSDRLTLDDRNLIWREKQADIALSMMHSQKDLLLGMGPTAVVPMTAQVTNELHFGYHSIFWTFGFLGLALLSVIVLQALLGLFGPHARPYWREMWIVVLFVASNGAYIPAFTSADFAVVLVLASAYLWLPRTSVSAEAHAAGLIPRQPLAQSIRGPMPAPRRWSQMAREGHAAR